MAITATAELEFAPVAARGIALLLPEDLTRGNLTIELGLSLWMHRTGTDLAGVRSELLGVRRALLKASGLDAPSEPVPLFAGDLRNGVLGLAVYLDDLISRAGRHAGLDRSAIVEVALGLL